MAGLRRLAGINRSWFRLPGSDLLDSQTTYPMNDERNPALPIPLSKAPAAPPTGVRAPPTAIWKLDFVIWCNVWNTFLQACLCGFMWGMNRYVRVLFFSLYFFQISSLFWNCSMLDAVSERVENDTLTMWRAGTTAPHGRQASS